MPVRCSVQMSGGPRKSGHVKWSSDGYSLLPPSLNLENDVYICCHHTVKIIVYVPFFRIKSFMQHCVAQRHEYGASSFVFNPRDRCKNQINTTRPFQPFHWGFSSLSGCTLLAVRSVWAKVKMWLCYT